MARFDEIYALYASKYNLDDLDSPNDLSNLATMINIQVIVERLQKELLRLSDDPTQNGKAIQQTTENIASLIERGLQLERALVLDRKTRKTDKAQSVVDYIASLKNMAREYLDEQFVKVYCNTCNILIMRVFPVYREMPYKLEIKCPQCKEEYILTQKEKEPLFDLSVKERAWRKNYPHNVRQAEKELPVDTEDDVILEGDDEAPVN